MKMRKVLCLVLSLVLVLPLFASCGGEEKYTVTCSIVFREPKAEYADLTTEELAELKAGGKTDDDLYDKCFNYPDFEIEGTEEQLNILNVAEQALQKQEIDYELSKDGNSISSVFDHTERDAVDSEFGYYSYWLCTIDGSVSNSGRQSETPVYDESEIVFTWTSSLKPRQDTDAVVTTNPDEDTTGVYEEDTTVEEETEDLS